MLPGSRRSPSEEPQDPTAPGLSTGRFTEQQLLILSELVEWWTNRRNQEDSRAPLRTMFGGIDNSGTVTTTGLAAGTITFDQTLLNATGTSTGASFLASAFGIPNPDTVGEVYSIVALLHFYDPPNSGYLSRYTQIARAPSGTTSTEIRAGVDVGGAPVVQIVGVTGLTINWTIELFALEL